MNGQEILGMIMLCGMVACIFIGFPIAFTLLFLALVFGGIGLGWEQTFSLSYLQIWGSMKDDILPSVPAFIFMGYMCDQAGLMARLFNSFRHMLAWMRGSLYLVVLLTATLFGIASGIVGSTVTMMGIMAGPMMIKAGYDAKLCAGAITAGGTLGILIPPSVMLIVMGPTMGVPVNLLYAAAFGPGFLLAGMYIAYCLIRSYINPSLGPPVPLEERVTDRWLIFKEVVIGIVPVTLLTVATLGVIIAGMATSTEAAACGAVGAVMLAACYGKLTFGALKGAIVDTAVTTGMVMMLAVASTIFGAVFTKLGSATVLANMLLNIPLGDAGKFWLIMAIIFLLGWPFEWLVIVLVFLPLFLPVVEKLDFGMSKLDTMIWFGTMVAVNLQTAYLSPPVAMSAYYLKSVVPQWSIGTIYKGMGEFMVLQLICLAILYYWPGLAMGLVDLAR
jgi:tripartite ATP-independent transporter DctM subunit